MTTAAQKTWDQLLTDIADTMRRWHVWDWRVESPFAQLKARERQKQMRAGQTMEQRSVTLVFTRVHPDTLKAQELRLSVNREDTALANLELLAKTAAHLRMAEVRGIERLVMKLYRQMYPAPGQAVPPPPPPPPRERVRSTGPHAVLHIADDAPLEIAEAAYRAAIKAAHPDHGGNHAETVALNAAIEAIRTGKAGTRQ